MTKTIGGAVDGLRNGNVGIVGGAVKKGLELAVSAAVVAVVAIFKLQSFAKNLAAPIKKILGIVTELIEKAVKWLIDNVICKIPGVSKLVPGCKDPCDKKNQGAHSCFVAGTQVWLGNGTTASIEDLKVGQRVVTFTDDEDSIRSEHFEGYAVNEEVISEETHRLIRLVVLGESNDNVDSLEDGGIATLVATSTVELLRDLDWIEAQGASVGETIELDMPEMSICGPAEVVAIEACPEIEEGDGQIVTATFHHDSGDVYDLQLEDESETIGVTGTHPFWSVDRNEWVPAADLEIGETLKTRGGTTGVESIRNRQASASVYNIEVETDHVYRVGDSGVLVHNYSPNEGEKCCSEFNDIVDFCNDPEFQENFPYDSATDACKSQSGNKTGVRPGNLGPSRTTPFGCSGIKRTQHGRCFPNERFSVFSCVCCTENGTDFKWNVAEER